MNLIFIYHFSFCFFVFCFCHTAYFSGVCQDATVTSTSTSTATTTITPTLSSLYWWFDCNKSIANTSGNSLNSTIPASDSSSNVSPKWRPSANTIDFNTTTKNTMRTSIFAYINDKVTYYKYLNFIYYNKDSNIYNIYNICNDSHAILITPSATTFSDKNVNLYYSNHIMQHIYVISEENCCNYSDIADVFGFVTTTREENINTSSVMWNESYYNYHYFLILNDSVNTFNFYNDFSIDTTFSICPKNDTSAITSSTLIEMLHIDNEAHATRLSNNYKIFDSDSKQSVVIPLLLDRFNVRVTNGSISYTYGLSQTPLTTAASISSENSPTVNSIDIRALVPPTRYSPAPLDVTIYQDGDHFTVDDYYLVDFAVYKKEVFWIKFNNINDTRTTTTTTAILSPFSNQCTHKTESNCNYKNSHSDDRILRNNSLCVYIYHRYKSTVINTNNDGIISLELNFDDDDLSDEYNDYSMILDLSNYFNVNSNVVNSLPIDCNDSKIVYFYVKEDSYISPACCIVSDNQEIELSFSRCDLAIDVSNFYVFFLNKIFDHYATFMLRQLVICMIIHAVYVT